MGFKDFDDENNNSSEDCNYYKLSFQPFYSKLEGKQAGRNKICIYIVNLCPKKFRGKHIIHTLLLTRFLINTQEKKKTDDWGWVGGDLKKTHYPTWIFCEKDGTFKKCKFLYLLFTINTALLTLWTKVFNGEHLSHENGRFAGGKRQHSMKSGSTTAVLSRAAQDLPGFITEVLWNVIR